MVDTEFNKTIDLGNLCVFDSNNLGLELDEDNIVERTKGNLKLIFSELFKLKTNQIGQDEEERDYDKPINAVKLPNPSVILPRGLPIPKQDKNQTKWEKFAEEKGIQKIKKRSRMIWSEELQKYLPRWGKGSLRKEETNAKWVIEDKPKYEGKNPFTYEKQELKLKHLKQDQRQKQNEQTFLNKKRNKDGKLKEDKKAQRKNLEIVQKSTASQGRFDKKLKNEAKINPLKKQKLAKEIVLNKKQEKERDSKILNKILKDK